MELSRSQIAAYYAARVPSLRRQGEQWRGPCPIHQGTRESFAVEAATGRWMCHSHCGRGGDIVALEMELSGTDRRAALEAISSLCGASAPRRVVAEYTYTDAQGYMLYQVVRFDPKGFAQRRPAPSGGWVWNLGGTPRVLYRLHRLLAALPEDVVWIVEGEKDVHTMEYWGLLATTNAGGAGKWPDSAAEALAGRQVAIVPDADEPGARHAQAVVEALRGVAKEVRVVRLPLGKDVTEWNGGPEELERMYGETPPFDYGISAISPISAFPQPLPSPYWGPIRPWPAPLGDAAYHGIVGRIVRLVDPHTEADPASLLLQLLVGFGNLAGRHGHFVAEADRHYSNLFTVLVGDTAKGRKGSSWGIIFRLLEEIDRQWTVKQIRSGLASGEGLINAVRDRAPQDEEDPATADDKRLLVMEPEFARVLLVCERDSNTTSAVLREAWDSGSLSTLTRNDPMSSHGAHISMVGHVTSTDLRRYLTSTAAGNGFANRFLWVCVRRSKLLPEGGLFHTLDMRDILAQLAEAARFARTAGELRRDEAARALWRAEYARLSEGLPGLLGAVTSRSEAQTMRLACLYALLDGCGEIRLPHLRAGLEVWRYCEDSARYIFGDSTGNVLADRILDLLKERGETPRYDLAEHVGRPPRRRLEEALHELAIARMVTMRYAKTGTGAGRPAELWRAA